jgi:hypothetical protein
MSRRFARLTAVRVVFFGAVLTAQSALAQSWTPLVRLSPSFPNSMRLLTDGSVMVQACNTNPTCNQWMRLSPSALGSYSNGTWSTTIAPMGLQRLYYASHVLQDGRVWILGGEYSGASLTQNVTNTGEIYDPVADAWSAIAPHPNAQFGDDPTMLLNNGKILAGSIFTGFTYLYTIATNSWSAPIPKVYNDRSDEETWVLLGDGRVLTYDIFRSSSTGGSYAEVFDPSTNHWSSISPSDGSANGFIPQLSGPTTGSELGPFVRLHDGRVFGIGATGHTALYEPATNTWSAGPDILDGGVIWGACDAPAAVMPNGHVMFIADASPQFTTPFHAPTRIFDFDPATNSITPINPPLATSALLNSPAFPTRLLMLPNGQVLFNDASRQMWVYTPAGPIDPTVRPIVNDVTYQGGGVFTLTGLRLNGQSAGSAYGDDAESDQNYPIVRLVNATGTFYARTTNWSNTLVATGTLPETVNFTLPSGITPGNYALIVSGSGLSGIPLFVNLTANQIAAGPVSEGASAERASHANAAPSKVTP